MNQKDPFVLLVVAILVVGLLWSLLFGEFLHWVPFVLALVVVSWLKIRLEI